MIAKLFEPLIARVLGAVSLVLLIALGAQSVRASHYAHKAEQCAAGRAADRQAYVQAQREAEAKAVAQKQAVEAAYKAKAEKTDEAYQTALARAQRAAAAYAERMRVKAPGGASGKPGSPAPSDPAKGSNGPGADAVILDRHDFDVMVENSVRLKEAHDWALTLSQTSLQIHRDLSPPDPAF